jgi:urea transport system substrate-binding protein
VIPAVDYLIGQGRKRFFLLGTDTVYPRTTNAILKSYLNAQGVADEDVAEFYTPFNHKNWEEVVTWIRRFGASGDAAIVTSDANIYFYRELGRQGITAEPLPAMTLSIGEGELPAMTASRTPLHAEPASWRSRASILPGFHDLRHSCASRNPGTK